MKHLDLFSGIGGFALAARWMGWDTVGFCEIDKYCHKVLNKNFPGVPIYEDIKELKYDGTKTDIITGGFPCQPFSHAGKRKGKDDDRYLWGEMLRVVQEFKPRWVVGENVAGLISILNGRTLERILIDLEDSGYNTESFLIPACSVGAWHRRDRVWIVANANHNRGQVRHPERKKPGRQRKADNAMPLCEDVSNPESKRMERSRSNREQVTQTQTGEGLPGCDSTRNGGADGQLESGLGMLVDGIPSWVAEPEGVPRVATGVKNRVDKLKALGNAITPQVALEIFKAIEQYELQR